MVFQYINIRQVPRDVLKTVASGLGFQHLPRDVRMLMHEMHEKPCLVPLFLHGGAHINMDYPGKATITEHSSPKTLIKVGLTRNEITEQHSYENILTNQRGTATA